MAFTNLSSARSTKPKDHTIVFNEQMNFIKQLGTF